MRMYDYTDQYVRLEEKLLSGEIDEQTYQDTLESFSDDAFTKAENVAKMIDNFKARAKALKEEEDSLKAKRKTTERSIEWLQYNLEQFLRATGKDKLEVGIYKMSFVKSPPSVEILNDKAIPRAYKIPQPDKIDKRSIMTALKDGEAVRGARLVTDKVNFRLRK